MCVARVEIQTESLGSHLTVVQFSAGTLLQPRRAADLLLDLNQEFSNREILQPLFGLVGYLCYAAYAFVQIFFIWTINTIIYDAADALRFNTIIYDASKGPTNMIPSRAVSFLS